MSFKTHPVSFVSEKIVFAQDMAKFEKIAIDAGDATSNEYMEKAAEGIFDRLLDFMEERSLKREVVLLCAKGNNSGDAYAVGHRLLEKNIKTIAYQLFPWENCSELCQKHGKQFTKKGGEVRFVSSIQDVEIPQTATVLDGLLGTGCRGPVDGILSEIIDRVNHSDNPVVSIDIPSGIQGDSGKVQGSGIYADLTLYLGQLKVGHFYNEGFERIGDLQGVDFGMSLEFAEKIPQFGHLVNPEIIRYNLTHIKRTANKYSVGEVLLVAGSPGMPGAAQIASYAALRAGAGMVRLFHPESMQCELSGTWPEVVRISYTSDDISSIEQEFSRAKALLVGSGLGRSADVPKILQKIYEKCSLPKVIDADALYFFHQTPTKGAILTPHKGELCHLLSIDSEIDDLDLLEQAEQFASKHEVTIVCKGAPTTIVSPGQEKVIIPYGNKGMASGGMGDALAGIIATMLAQGKSLHEAAVLGTTLHALSGDRAKAARAERSLIATDLIDAISLVFRGMTNA